jgi:hypothetical protein
MAGKSGIPTRNLAVGKGQGLLMSPTQGQADIIGATFAPAISKHLKAFLYGWLPLSDAAGIILSILGIPLLFLLTMSFCCWALQMPMFDTLDFKFFITSFCQ